MHWVRGCDIGYGDVTLGTGMCIGYEDVTSGMGCDIGYMDVTNSIGKGDNGYRKKQWVQQLLRWV